MPLSKRLVLIALALAAGLGLPGSPRGAARGEEPKAEPARNTCSSGSTTRRSCSSTPTGSRRSPSRRRS